MSYSYAYMNQFLLCFIIHFPPNGIMLHQTDIVFPNLAFEATYKYFTFNEKYS